MKSAQSAPGRTVVFGSSDTDNSLSKRSLVYYKSQSSAGGSIPGESSQTTKNQSNSCFGNPTIRDIIDAEKFIKSGHSDCKDFRTRLYESQIFANFLELDNKMKYLLPSFEKIPIAQFPPEEQAESSECSSQDTLYLI